jgi:hypothetical protein
MQASLSESLNGITDKIVIITSLIPNFANNKTSKAVVF